jgi:ribosome biogenesis GTPase / thiamine phosphate phosphatase
VFRFDRSIPGRVVRHDKGGYFVFCEHGELLCELRGRLRKTLRGEQRPGVGDWVALTPRLDEHRGAIDEVLVRTSVLLRKTAGLRAEAQVIAANIDTALICVPCDAEPNPRRVERELSIVMESGATPVIVLTKADLLTGTGDEVTAWLPPVAGDTAVVRVSASDLGNVDVLEPWNRKGATLVVIGPSGAGKSTLANALLRDERLVTGAVRNTDFRGRHTTTWRELVVLPSGALLIDTPGIREVALWDADMGVSAAFDDVTEVTKRCRFANCSHGNEPGCAVGAALADGSLDAERWSGYQKLQDELAFQAERNTSRLAADEKRKFDKLVRDSRREPHR